MIQIEGDIWEFYKRDYHIVVPTNLTTRRNGSAVMGRGVARQAAEKFPALEGWYGAQLRKSGPGEQAAPCLHENWRIICFPVKRHWSDRADLALIDAAAAELRELSEAVVITRIALPLIGCGFGELEENQVLPILEQHLDTDASSFRPGARVDRS